MKDENRKELCQKEFEKIIKKLQKNVDRNLVELVEKWRLGVDDEEFCAFANAIELKFAGAIILHKKELEMNPKNLQIKSLFNVKLKQLVLSFADTFEYEAEKFNNYYNKIKDL